MVILCGVAICITGIAFAGAAGISKERELSEEQKRAAISEFSLKRGLLVATFCGIMSACFAYGLAAGDPIKQITLRHGTPVLWQGLPVLVVVLVGGFTTNFIWCLILNIRNRTGYQYFSSKVRGEIPARDGGADPRDRHRRAGRGNGRSAGPRAGVQPDKAPMLANYCFCALAGTTWYMQFFFYTMGETQMGNFKFSSWTLHMASIIIFSTLWGIALQGVERRRHAHQVAGRAEPVCAGGFHRDRGLRELPGTRPGRSERRCSRRTRYSSQPLRYSLTKYLFASGTFVTFIPAAS